MATLLYIKPALLGYHMTAAMLKDIINERDCTTCTQVSDFYQNPNM